MKKQRYIKPRETQYKLLWTPEPYMGNTSMKPHENIEEPDARIILLAGISKTQVLIINVSETQRCGGLEILYY